MCGFAQEIAAKRAAVFAFLVLAAVGMPVGSVVPAAVAQTESEQECRDLSEISDTYYRRDREEGIRVLAKCITTPPCYEKKDLQDTVLNILWDYFSVVEDPSQFKFLVYHIARCGNSDVVLDRFLGTSLYALAEEGVDEYKTPDKISLEVTQEPVQVGSTVRFEAQIRNRRGDLLKHRDVELECAIEPRECGTCNASGRSFTVIKAGEATLRVWAKDHPKAEKTASILIEGGAGPGRPPPSIEKVVPESGTALSDIRIFGEDFHEVADSNIVVFIGATTVARDVSIDPVGLDRLDVTVPEGAMTGPIGVRIPGVGQAKTTSDFKVLKRLSIERPSKKLPLLATGATAAAGAGYLYFHSEATKEGITTEEWEDKARWEEVCGGVTIATAVVSGYLWYRHFKQKGKYDKAVEGIGGKIGLGLDAGRRRIVLSYRF